MGAPRSSARRRPLCAERTTSTWLATRSSTWRSFGSRRESRGRCARRCPATCRTQRMRAEAKPDLEALSVLPPFAGAPFGGLLGLGSGSGPGRDRGFYWELDAVGALAGEPAVIDLSPVYDLLREELGDLNIEGAAVRGERFLPLSPRQRRRWAQRDRRARARSCGRVDDGRPVDRRRRARWICASTTSASSVGLGCASATPRRSPMTWSSSQRPPRPMATATRRFAGRWSARSTARAGCAGSARSTASGRSRGSTPRSRPG